MCKGDYSLTDDYEKELLKINVSHNENITKSRNVYLNSNTMQCNEVNVNI